MYRQFDQEFKDNAVRLALEKKIKLNNLAKDLGIGRSTLSKWISTHWKGQPISSGVIAEDQREFATWKMAEVLNVSKSGYYRFLQRPKKRIKAKSDENH